MTKTANKKTGGIKKWANEKSKLSPWIANNSIYKVIARPGTEYGVQVFKISETVLGNLEEWQSKQLNKSLKIEAHMVMT